MKKIERVSLIGLGAIGCAQAQKIVDAIHGILNIIADERRIERYRKDGFIINKKKYDFNYITPVEDCPPDDLIIISVKNNDLPGAISDIKKHVGNDTIILSLLNGISSEEEIGEVYGMDKLLYSLCINVDAVKVGNIITFSNPGRINFGEASNEKYSIKVNLVRDFFESVHIDHEIPVDMLKSLWWKYMINVGINQTSAILGANYGVFQKTSEARRVMEMAMLEVISISQKIGMGLTVDDLKPWYDILNNISPYGKTSMLQDIEAGRVTEVDLFGGTVIKLGKKYEVPTPINEMLYYLIKAKEKIGQEM